MSDVNTTTSSDQPQDHPQPPAEPTYNVRSVPVVTDERQLVLQRRHGGGGERYLQLRVIADAGEASLLNNWPGETVLVLTQEVAEQLAKRLLGDTQLDSDIVSSTLVPTGSPLELVYEPKPKEPPATPGGG